ncbi:unnamed protein product [Heterobilharzia americana]|nr:unnamed protein product [Heterobilharzia americana]
MKRSSTSSVGVSSTSDAGSKRKFVPNITNALNKSRLNDNVSKFPRQDGPKPRTEPRSTRSYQNNTERPMYQNSKPQFVHSYSIFETGIGCAAKLDKNAVELCETKETVLPQTESAEFSEAESTLNPLNQCEAFITDIKQLFKTPPVIMHDSAAGQEFDLDPFRDLDLSYGWSSRFPFNLFSESTDSGKLFTLQLPDKLLPPENEQLKTVYSENYNCWIIRKFDWLSVTLDSIYPVLDVNFSIGCCTCK